MTSSTRRAHQRRNSNGTVSFVREHSYNPGSPGSSLFAQDAEELNQDHDRQGVTYPNARCPRCEQRVYFFAAYNGGRVFFNDLGHPWEKHGCMISEQDKLPSASGLGFAAAEFAPKTEYSISVFPRSSGNVIGLRKGDDTGYFLCRSNLDAMYFSAASPIFNERSFVEQISVLNTRFEVCNLAVQPCSNPGSLNSDLRRSMSA